MTEPGRDDAMIEIGDMDEDPTPAAPEPPRVVIEYRDRGVPWMLVPPLVAAAVVVAVVVALGLNGRFHPRRTPIAVAPARAAGIPSPDRPLPGGPPGDATASAEPPANPPVLVGLVPNPAVVEAPPAVLPAAPPAVVPTGPAPASAPLAAPPEAVAVEAPPAAPVEAAKPAAPPAFVGLDPTLFDTPNAPNPGPPGEAPRDPGLAMTGQPDAPGEPAAKAGPDQPEDVDPELLPPDPKRSIEERRRRAIEARRELEDDRVRFHAAVSQVIRQFRWRAAPKIREICQEFQQGVPPIAVQQARKLLGKTGIHAGAGTAQRINLLRQLGFPEPAILGDLFDVMTSFEGPGGRNMPSKEELYVRSAVLLLKHPPARRPSPTTAAATTRPVSSGPSGPRP